MFCTNCGAPVTEGQKFCNKCGTPVNVLAVNVDAAPKMEAKSRKKKEKPRKAEKPQKAVNPGKKNNGVIIAILLAIIILLTAISTLAGYAIINYFKNEAAIEEYTEYGFDDTGITVEPPEDVADIDELLEEYNEEISENIETEPTGQRIPYGYADVYADVDRVLIVPNGFVGDDTVIWNGKTMGGFCDYIDDNVFKGQSPVNRDMLYKLVAIHVIDPELVPDDETFMTIMKYCMIVMAEFRDSGAVMNNAVFTPSQPNRYNYEMEINGEKSTWMIDYDTHEVTLNDGKTEYSSAGDYGMFTDQSMVIWMYAISEYFEFE